MENKLYEAFSLYSDEEVIDSDTLDDTFDSMTETTELEQEVNSLKTDVENIKTMLDNMTVVDGDFMISVVPEKSPEEVHEDNICNYFTKFAKIPVDSNITEELLETNTYKNAWIPSIATRVGSSREEVKDVLLKRARESDK